MRNISLKKLVLRGLLTLGVGAVLIANSQAATVGVSGYTNAFTTQPAAADWATLSVGTSSATYTNAAGLDAAVVLNVAANITAQLGNPGGSPPAAVAAAVWSTNGYVQTRPTGNDYNLLIAKLVNDTGTNATTIHIQYSFSQPAFALESTNGVDGHRVFYSLTGAAGSWTLLPSFCSVNASNTTVTVSTNLNLVWNDGGNLYLLWADDNGPPTDSPNQIDNFSLSVVAGTRAVFSVAVSTPTNGQVFAKGGIVNVTATGIGAITNLNLYLDDALLLSGSAAPLTTNLATCSMALGTHKVYARGIAKGASTNSLTNTFTLIANTVTLNNAGPASVPVGTPFTLNATAANDSGVASMDFYVNSVKAFTRTNAPWTYVASGLPPGTYTNYVVATDFCGQTNTSASITVTVDGTIIYYNDFSIQPVASAWSFLSVAGAGTDITTSADLDTAVEALTATSIFNQVVVDTNNPPPGATPNAVWSSIGKFLQTRPTGNKFTALMATLTNNTGEDIHTFVVGYTFAQALVTADEISGHRVYFSLTGATNSWTNVAGLSSATPGQLVTNINATWHSNTVLHMLWVDDNGSGAPDTANQIDNFFVAVGMPPAIVAQPENTLVCLGRTATFTVSASGSLPLKYQWRKITPASTNNIANATNALFSILSASPSDVAGYSVVITNTFGSVTSTVATLSLSTNAVAIVAQPQSTISLYGTPGSFAVGIDPAAAQPYYYQWYANIFPENLTGAPISGANGPVFTIPSVAPSNEAYYYVVASNCSGSATSQVASLKVTYAPVVITSQPQNVQAAPGATASFIVGATGDFLSYQWYKNNTVISGATNATLTLTNVQDADLGYYHALVSNPAGFRPSARAALLVSLVSYDIVPLTNQVWRYNQGGASLGTAWKEVNYNDSSWSTGRGVFANETNNAVVQALTNTVLALTTPTPVTHIITYYFRTTFNLTNDLTRLSITCLNLIDDGCVVYLNGVEAYRLRIASDVTVAYDTLAANATEGVFDVTNLPSHLLVPGTNVLAVEVHQTSATSSDVAFGFSARVDSLIPTHTPEITSQPQDLSVVELRPATFTVGYVGEAAVLQWYKLTTNGDQLIPGANQTSLTLANPIRGVDDQNLYYAVISNALSGISGPTISRKASLVITPNTNGPVLLYADGSSAGNIITLSYDERLLLSDTNNPTGSPINAANYTVTNTFGESIGILKAEWGPAGTNGTNVVLTTTSYRRTDANYIVTVKSIRDDSPLHNLSTNLACPVSTLLKIVTWDDGRWDFSQPDPVSWFDYDPTLWPAFTNGNWRRPDYVIDRASGIWAEPPTVSIYNVYPDLGAMSDWPAPPGSSLVSGWYNYNAYFRHQFNYNASPQGATAWMSYLVGDGAVFYLNNVEFRRYNMPAGTTQPTTFASTSIGDPNVQGPMSMSLSNLLLGTNLLAVELHASAANDLTMVFGMEFTARIDSLVTGKVVITTAPGNVTVAQGQDATWSFRSAGGRSFQWLTNGTAVPGGTNFTFGMADVPFSADGTLVSIAITGASGSVTSAPALLTVLPDTNAPVLVSALISASNAITVAYSKDVTETTATNILNYAITNILGGAPLTITDISLANGTNAIIHVSSLPTGIYIVVVNNVTDISASHNTILPNSRVSVGVENFPLLSIDATTRWKYSYTNETDQGTAWRGTDYDDSAWSVGAGLFDGKKGGRVATELPETVRTVLLVTNKTVNDIPTYYFRTEFVLPPFYGQGATLGIRPVLDDGAAFYLNGQLVYSIGVTIPTTYAAYATRSIGNAAYEGPFNVSAGGLVPGVNTLAVEVKNVNATSSDITFGTWLYLNVPSSYVVPLPVVVSGPTVTPTNHLYTGEAFSISVEATSTTPFRYQWRKWGTNIVAATNDTLSFSNITPANSGEYDVVLSNPFGDTVSPVAAVHVGPLPPPVIVSGPTVVPSTLIDPGHAFSISVVATGAPSLHYQWRKNGADIPSGTNDTISVASPTANDAGVYEVMVSNPYGQTPSTYVVMTSTGGAPPLIDSGPTVSPTNNLATGASFSLTVTASGVDPFQYQWRKGTVPLLYRTNVTENFTGVTTNDSGSYDVIVSNTYGSTPSGSVTVTVRPPPARPNLHIAPTNLNQVRIWWTNTSETFTLERTNRLGTLPNAWIYVTNQSPYVGPAINTAEFYRLKF